MAKICPVCGEKIYLLYADSIIREDGIEIHVDCNDVPEDAKKKQQAIEDKSVHVKSFDMPFGDMVGFMVKWALASIPAFIILAIIGGIFFAIFTAIFVSTR